MRHNWALALAVLVAGCDQQPAPPTDITATPQEVVTPQELVDLSSQYTAISENVLRRLSITANGFADAVDGLLQDPSADRLATAQQVWSQFYLAFNESRVVLECRALANDMDRQRLLRSDPFPILPGYIDSLQQWPGSGIVNDVTVDLSREALLDQQGATSDMEASLGFQVIQFLLFGEPGAPRKASAFRAGVTSAPAALPTADDISVAEDMHAEADDEMAGDEDLAMPVPTDQPGRRREYLGTATALLVEDMQLLARQDAPVNVNGQTCPTEAIRRTMAQMLRLANLQDISNVAGEYLSDAALKQARTGLHTAQAEWLQEKSAFIAWGKFVAPELATQIDSLYLSPAAADDVEALQQAHALLTTLARRKASASRPATPPTSSSP